MPPAQNASAPEPGVPHPLEEVPQSFLAGSSYDVREELGDLISRDLLGPWAGESEALPPHSAGPRERYLVGLLGPRPLPAEQPVRDAAGLAEAEVVAEGDARDPGGTERLTPQAAGRLWASSMGLSFLVPADVGVLRVVASWGRYRQSNSKAEDGSTVRVWSREPVRHDVDIAVGTRGTFRTVLEGEDDDPGAPCVQLRVHVRERPGTVDGADNLRFVDVSLINALEESRELRDGQWLFQTKLEVTSFDGQAGVFLPVDDPLSEEPGRIPESPEEQHLRLLYRDELKHAHGRNVAVHATPLPGSRRALRLETAWLPVKNVPATVAPTTAQQPLLTGLELSMDRLAELAVWEHRDALLTALQPLADGYDGWLAQQAAKADSLPGPLRTTALRAVDEARDACARIALGIELLHADRDALRAFRFANRAMAMQRRATATAALRAGGGESPPPYAAAYAEVAGRGAAGASWRPFQLAFVLLNLCSLTDPAHKERRADSSATVDLLFFPTGGGKTEAYLGLTAYTFAIRRLQKAVGAGEDARDGRDGVAVLMRYTLRLLTAQQFQRASALVCAAEVLRREEESVWGGTPFRIGLWVGSGVSPNWYGDAAQQIAEATESASGRHVNVLQVLTCPWCGEELRAWRDLETDDVRRRILVYCPRGEDAEPCPFSRMLARGEGLPILTVDEEIYRLVPSLLIATVDKLAQLPWRGYAGLLFGRVTAHCERHGYRHDDLDEEIGCGARHNAKGRYRAVTSRPMVRRLRPPDLIIQDELHLISGALGTTVGLFESAVDQLCTWRVRDARGQLRETGPKIVASTATTRNARAQVLGVFARDLAIFPPQVIDVGDTFFSRQVEISRENPGRRYYGVCAHGVRMKAAEIRVAEILLLAGQHLFDRYGAPADPYMTVVGYFNATKELAGMRRILDDDVPSRLRANRSRKDIADRLLRDTEMLNLQELTSRVSSADISAALKRLEIGFSPEYDTTVRKRAIIDELRDAGRSREPRVFPVPLERRPVDYVLATSMLQVGVDVSRFGLMVVTGQPKNTAEYIQASSRVGRDAARPGIVLTLYNWSRPRDLAHFEDFEHYHATFYRQVEALSVTPFTRRSLDRGTTAAYIAAVRHACDEFSGNTDAERVVLDDPRVREAERRLLARAEAVDGDRARGYLAERIDALRDAWQARKSEQGRLGYRGQTRQKQTVLGLLRNADGNGWDVLTVPQSMRETENEINMLLPGDTVLTAPAGPDWEFGPPAEDGDGDGTEGAGGNASGALPDTGGDGDNTTRGQGS
ncbi:DISARM system helicase DrmA [Streptomyces aidingensis]|uniref:Helicase conserved C-terminal domain-containing protein n=1 Tax=Streptomyces aidingensis TaxID=910347 RepID=A0A1I1URL1_9ACTN|nr:DISARM system helicase DrmA [Streptomyces aidingensis]SFD73225.1 Helicase conserved C-terminal domain-containing protein [Streptomyces aidingensis]